MLAALGAGVTVTGCRAAEAKTPKGALTAAQTRRIVMLVAQHDQIDLSDTHIELNSMDLASDFIPGYSSFIVIRESSTPGPDETLRRYAVNRSTGDVWEMTLCRHYDFPELTAMRQSFARQSTGASELAAQSKQLGCNTGKGSSTL